ncbi:MAG: FixH family protein [Acidobacteriota bacterium]
MTSRWLVFMALLALACTGGGSSDAPPPPAPVPTLPPVVGGELESGDGRWRVTWAPDPSPLPTGETFAVDVTVAPVDAEAKLPRDLKLSVDAGMPHHGHGMNVFPEVTAQGEGSFRAEGLLFHMPGSWDVYFDVTDGAFTERAQTEVEIE